MKFIGRTVVLLLIVNILLVYMHYKQAGDVIAKDPGAQTYQQEIEVMNRSDALYIRHHFSGLSQGRHEIIWPEASTDRSCHALDAISCGRLDASLTAFVDGDNEKQSISYKIPKEGSKSQAMLYHEPFVILQGATVTSTLFHITDETRMGGMWVNGLEQVGSKQMDLIDYTFFQGSGGVQDLYWQKNSLPLVYEGQKLAVYGAAGNVEQFQAIDAALETIGADHSTMVIDQTSIAVQSQRFIVSENADIDKASNLFLTSAMAARFSISQEERLLVEVLASILGDKVTGAEQSRQAYDKLIVALTPEELALLKEVVNSKAGQEMNATILDDLIKEVTGFKTSYFKTAIQKDTADHLFLFEDTREVRVDGTSYADIGIVLKDGKSLYPAKSILSHLGYTVTANEQSLYIEKEGRKFRFPRKEPFYVYNERKFDVRTSPFEVLSDEVYFEESWFRRLFLLTVDKTAETIDIVNLSAVLEEVSE